MLFFILSNKSLIETNKSFLTGTAISAAAVGVGALKSETKSISVISVSWPIAEIIGIFDSKTLRTRSSSLKPHKSSILPPPLAIIITSGFSKLLCSNKWKPSMASITSSEDDSPWTLTGHNVTLTGNLSWILWSISFITAPVAVSYTHLTLPTKRIV